MVACGRRSPVLALLMVGGLLVVDVAGIVDKEQLRVIREGNGNHESLASEGQVEEAGDQDTEAFLAALLRLEKILNHTHGCDKRLQELWRDVTIRRLTLERLEEDIFHLMDKYAKVQAEDPTTDECPEPFAARGGGCFYYPHGEKNTWAGARYSCVRLGGDLAHPDDLPSFKKYVKTIASGDWGYFFLGGKTDPKLEFPAFRWLDGRSIAGENMYSELFSFSSDFCLAMEAHNRFKIKAKHCDNHKRWYICEIKVKNKTLTPGGDDPAVQV
ncbi:uncharacterized protein LOC121853880 [Homarus americanus]|uniref:Putative Lectin C-type domain-containing protein 10 n=1 Tax=Homarus americanus TaxID=6706 RepID=A0A8J5MLV6_HOMAM|nr:uncharacterized protein LOC121853880 [Homarus americanus]KAG7156278.1 putative Lectin C-type domain-containing protein 10 [Homarus americanus]